jgi:hypothetical protein
MSEEDDEMLYREMNEEDPFYMGDDPEGCYNDREDFSMEDASEESESDNEQGTQKDEDGQRNKKHKGCLLPILVLLLLILIHAENFL